MKVAIINYFAQATDSLAESLHLKPNERDPRDQSGLIHHFYYLLAPWFAFTIVVRALLFAVIYTSEDGSVSEILYLPNSS